MYNMKYFENAREGKNHWLLYVALLAIGYVVAQIPSVVYLPIIYIRKAIHREISVPQNGDFSDVMKSSMEMFNDLPGFVVLMLSFVFWIGVTWLLFKPFHKRDRMTLISGEKRFRLGRFFVGVAGYLVIMGLVTVVALLISPETNITFQFDGSKYIVFVILAIILVPFQTGCEELIFRGYLMQGLGLCTKSKIWALVITSVTFGLMHSVNPEVFDYGFFKAIPIFILMGAMLGFFTIVDDGLEFSWGIHFINNFVAFAIFGNEGSTFGASPLFVQAKEEFSIAMWLTPILVTVVMYALLHKKLGWNLKEAFDNSGLKKEVVTTEN